MNLGCGDDRKPGWVNIDEDPACEPDQCQDALWNLRGRDTCSADEIYAGHFLEHLERDDGLVLLRECHRVLKPGGRIGLVVPDSRDVLRRYLTGEFDLDDTCEAFLYSTVQQSRHKWSYDLMTLRRVMEEAGFRVTDQIDRYHDPRLAAPAWFQCGLDATKDA